MAKFADRVGKIAEGVTGGYQKIEDGVVTGYRQIEDGVVSGYRKIENVFVNTFMSRNGKSAENARARMAENRQAREEKLRSDGEARAAARKERIAKNLEASRNVGKQN